MIWFTSQSRAVRAAKHKWICSHRCSGKKTFCNMLAFISFQQSRAPTYHPNYGSDLLDKGHSFEEQSDVSLQGL